MILDADPRKARAFEIEKWGTFAGLSKDVIQSGINAVNKDDWNKQEEIYKEIINGMKNNPEWVVDVPTDAEIRVMMAEEKAIQAAALESLNIETMNKNWNEKLKEEAKEYQTLAGLNISTLQYATTWDGMAEHKPLQAEIDKVLKDFLLWLF